ncbi:MAG: hypothetical protein A2189_09365 [Paenibacillus sp. RIFOXYA1_FULL_44_5]|nr:MAG: hypothetical protein A2189_09365 [Paenibacillus sp. RIFOXYA1_FULL_44_5]
MTEPLYTVNVICANCEHIFRTSRVRPSFKKPIKSDADFCSYFKEINPDYYTVRVCPDCGFSSTENFKSQLSDAQKHKYVQVVAGRWVQKDYGGMRNWHTALDTYKLALISAEIVGESYRVIAGLLHHIAWMYRYENQTQKEKRFLEFALLAYIRVFETESMEINQARLMFLIGELHRRLGQFHDAVKWFSRVVRDQRITDSAMIQRSREQWIRLREDMQHAGQNVEDIQEAVDY